MSVPSGEQFELVSGDQRAVVTEVGAALRSYAVGDDEIVEGFPEAELPSGGRGQVLAPWPNRLEDGAYSFGGKEIRAPLDEPDRHNAIHGLVRWLRWRIVERDAASVTLSCPLAPQPAYPFSLRLLVRYSLGAEGGLTVETIAANEGTEPLPFGLGFHPYLRQPSGLVDDLSLTLPAGSRLLLDDRGLPVGEEPVAGTAYDFSAGGGRPIAALRLDDCFTGLARTAAGSWEVSLADPIGGREVLLSADGSFDWLMVYTGDTLGDMSRRRHSIAIEPMTCPPNAFRSGEGLIVLCPGESFGASFGVRIVGRRGTEEARR